MIINEHVLRRGLLILGMFLFAMNLSCARAGAEPAADAAYQAAKALFDNRAYDEAARLLNDAVADDPENSADHSLLGQIYVQLDFQQQYKKYSRDRDVLPSGGREEEIAGQGTMASEINFRELARNHFDHAIQVNSNNYEDFIGRCVVAAQDEQEYWYKRTNEKFPYHVPPYALLNSFYVLQMVDQEGRAEPLAARRALTEVRTIQTNYLRILEEEPDRVAAANPEILAEDPDFIAHQKNFVKERLRLLDQTEADWEERHGIIGE